MSKDIKIVIVAITDEAGNLLMIRRVKDEDDGNGGKWEFAAGHIGPWEIPAVAATREVKEETGLSIFLLPHGIVIPTKKGKAAYYLGFVQGGKIKPKVKLAPDEHDKYLWVKAKDFDKVKPTHKHMKENLVDLLTHVSEKLEVPEKVAQKLIAAHDYWGLARQYEKLRRAASLSHTTPLRQRKGNIMKRQRRIQAQENTPSTNVFTLPGPGEELKEAILVGDEVEIFLKRHMNGGGETPEPSISGIVEKRDRNTVWVRSPEDDEEQLIPVNWNDRGDWAFVRVYRSPDQVVHYINGNPYDKDSKEVSKAKGLGLILESEPPTRYESVWALMRGETPDLDRSMGQAPESMDVVAPTNKPKPGTPDILTQVKDVVRSHGLEPDVVDHLGKGRVLILTQDGDLKKELIKVLEKSGKKVDASLQGRLIVREGASLSTMGTTTVPIATDDDLMLLTRKKRERDLKDQKNQERGKESARKIRSQGVQTAPQGVPLTPGQALQNQQNPQNQQTVVSPSNAGMVINPAQQQVRDFTSFYGMMPKVPMPGGGIMLKPNQTQQRKMVQDQAKDKNPMHTNPKASRSQILRVAASLARSLRDQEYDDSNHYISELRAMGVKESSIARSSIGSKRAWGHLHRYLEAAGEIENSRIARTAARLAPDL
jgi:8-oxo-dGTP pyrophosphatase MutT (NUDIX family)